MKKLQTPKPCKYCGSSRHLSFDCSSRKWQAYLTGESNQKPVTPLYVFEFHEKQRKRKSATRDG